MKWNITHPRAFKKGLLDAKPCGAVNAQCDELVGKIASFSHISVKEELVRTFKRLRNP